MTPEQKAFFEYGKAREALLIFKTDFAYREETLREFYENYVCEAWQKRAACRAWMSVKKRDCYNCKYRTISPDQYPCQGCYLDTTRKRWEPRKEGE